jgi:hypothetical protein
MKVDMHEMRRGGDGRAMDRDGVDDAGEGSPDVAAGQVGDQYGDEHAHCED